MLARIIARAIFSLFHTFFSFKSEQKRLGGKFSCKTLHPLFLICLYFIGAGGDANLKNYLAWPKRNMCYHKHSGFYGETSASKTDKPPTYHRHSDPAPNGCGCS